MTLNPFKRYDQRAARYLAEQQEAQLKAWAAEKRVAK